MADLINTAHAPTGLAAIFSTLFDGLAAIFNGIIDFISHLSLENLLREITSHVIQAVTENPIRTAILILSIVLTGNLLAAAGFGQIGVGAGSSAAAWQAAMGNVPAGSVFSALQSFAMRHGVVLPVIGGVLAVAEVVRLVVEQMGGGASDVMAERKKLMEQGMNGEVGDAEYEERIKELGGLGTWDCRSNGGRFRCSETGAFGRLDLMTRSEWLMAMGKKLMEQRMNGEVGEVEYEQIVEDLEVFGGLGRWNCWHDGGRFQCESSETGAYGRAGLMDVMTVRKVLIERKMNGQIPDDVYEQRIQEVGGLGTWDCWHDGGRFRCESSETGAYGEWI